MDMTIITFSHTCTHDYAAHDYAATARSCKRKQAAGSDHAPPAMKAADRGLGDGLERRDREKDRVGVAKWGGAALCASL